MHTCVQTHTHTDTRSKFELDGVNWDFEAVIRIKRLEIDCDETTGEQGRMWWEAEREDGWESGEKMVAGRENWTK